MDLSIIEVENFCTQHLAGYLSMPLLKKERPSLLLQNYTVREEGVKEIKKLHLCSEMKRGWEGKRVKSDKEVERLKVAVIGKITIEKWAKKILFKFHIFSSWFVSEKKN